MIGRPLDDLLCMWLLLVARVLLEAVVPLVPLPAANAAASAAAADAAAENAAALLPPFMPNGLSAAAAAPAVGMPAAAEPGLCGGGWRWDGGGAAAGAVRGCCCVPWRLGHTGAVVDHLQIQQSSRAGRWLLAHAMTSASCRPGWFTQQPANLF